MKYKLIHRKTGLETLCEKVTIDGFDYYVSNLAASPNDVVYSSVSNTIVRFTDPRHFSEGTYKKVIATNKPILDIPKVVYMVERLAYKYYTENEHYKVSDSFHFKNGYNKSQETHPFSEEDVRFMLSEAFNASQEGYQTTFDEILQLWKEQKPKTVYYE